MKTAALLVCVLLLGGCVSFHTEKPVTIEFRDRDTDQPLDDVRLCIIYNATMMLNSYPAIDIRDISGGINIPLPDYDGMSLWRVQVPQYEEFRVNTFGNERIPEEIKVAEDRAVIMMVPQQGTVE